jgi:micrococcal nuclease
MTTARLWDRSGRERLKDYPSINDSAYGRCMGLLRIISRLLFGKSSHGHSRDQQMPAARRRLPEACKRAYSQQELMRTVDQLEEADVLWVIDGDSVIVDCAGDEIEIRLASIDCPEGGQPWGDTAKYGLMKMIGRKSVRLELHGVDVYGRTLATILVWDTQKNLWLNVNERMVMLGHAWVKRQFFAYLPVDRQYALNRIENWAKSRKVGLWGTDNPVPPWMWRKGQQS